MKAVNHVGGGVEEGEGVVRSVERAEQHAQCAAAQGRHQARDRDDDHLHCRTRDRGGFERGVERDAFQLTERGLLRALLERGDDTRGGDDAGAAEACRGGRSEERAPREPRVCAHRFAMRGSYMTDPFVVLSALDT
jgi:hypothetical protein